MLINWKKIAKST